MPNALDNQIYYSDNISLSDCNNNNSNILTFKSQADSRSPFTFSDSPEMSIEHSEEDATVIDSMTGINSIIDDYSSLNSASLFSITNKQLLKSKYDEFIAGIINNYKSQIINIIMNDEYIDGEISESELFIDDILNIGDIEYVLEALMQLYYDNLDNPVILEGILVMLSYAPYDAVEPKGQIMAIGLLSNRALVVRDRAIRCFERWNSKKGLKVLRSLDCSPIWLQHYVDEIIMYIEKDGSE